MYAKVELTNEIISFINKIQHHTESFDEIKELVFTKKRLTSPISTTEMLNLTIQFQEIKRNTINKILNKQKLNFPEGLLFERLIVKYTGSNIPVEEHIKEIKANCCNIKNNKNINNLYDKFIEKLFINKKEV